LRIKWKVHLFTFSLNNKIYTSTTINKIYLGVKIYKNTNKIYKHSKLLFSKAVPLPLIM
jgi:hypothetical protein